MRSGWSPVALSRDVPASGVAPARLHDAGLVLWRTAEGTLGAWEDRCPHRGMRLSFGFVRDDRLTCLYHGWRFEAGGRCAHIPAHPQLNVPGTIRATVWQAVETAGLIWVARAAAQAATQTAGGLPEAAGLHPVRSVAVCCPLARTLAGLGIGPDPVDPWIWRDDLLLAWHAPDDATTMLHAVLRPPATPARMRAVDRELRALRDALEAA